MKNSASSFANYVYEQTTGDVRNPLEQSIGDHARQSIGVEAEKHRTQYESIAQNLGSHLKYKLIHDGTSASSSQKVYECRYLTREGNPIRCNPDLVFESTNHGADKKRSIIIVERKTRTGGDKYPSVPDESYPNVRAQLWCYAWIKEWDSLLNNNVILVTEYFWSADREIPPVYLGSRGAWRRSDMELHKEISKHFENFGGEIDEKIQYSLEENNSQFKKRNPLGEY